MSIKIRAFCRCIHNSIPPDPVGHGKAVSYFISCIHNSVKFVFDKIFSPGI